MNEPGTGLLLTCRRLSTIRNSVMAQKVEPCINLWLEKSSALTQVDQPALQRSGDGLGAIGNAELAENVIDVALNRRFANR